VSTVHRGVWRPEDRAAAPYRYLPVDVPAGVRTLRVELDYDRAAGVLDLGCFAPGGSFRGYSGGARGSFVLGESVATPGYLPGPLPAGTWQVLVGLHRVLATGVAWRVTAEPAAAAPAIERAAIEPATPGPGARRRRRVLPAAPGLTWLAGDLHTHTVHSDGSLTVPALAALAAGAGLDFLAVTDHNTISHHPELAAAGAAAGVLLLPGQEVTTGRGHANAFGALDWIDFRHRPDAWMSTVDAAGGLLSVNHPLGGDCAWLMPMTGRPPLAEVWHSGWWDRTWGAPLAWLLAWAPGAVPVGGSDFHTMDGPERPGLPTTWVAVAEPSVAGVLDGLRAGRVAVSAAPDAPVLLCDDGELVAVDADGTLLVDVEGRRRPVRGSTARFVATGPGPHWLEDANAQVLALTA
jgi:hypothetical protein